MKKWIRNLIDWAVVVGLILGVAYAMGLLTGFAKGNDAYGYLTKIRLIATYFPHINWNPFWDSGTPFSIWSYPPLPMTATTFIFVKLLGLTAEKALTAMAAVSFCLLGLGLYGFVNEVTGKRLAGLLTIVLFVSSPASWNWWAGGNYVRVFGLGFFGLSLWAMAAYFKRALADKETRGLFLALIIFTSLAVSSHLLIGGITMVVVFLYIFFIVPTLAGKLRFWLKIGILPFLSAAYYYFPMYLTGHVGSRFIGINPAFPVPLPCWFYPVTTKESYSLSPALSLGLLVGFFLIFFFFRKMTLSKFEKASLLAFVVFILGNTAYNSLGFLPFYPETWYIVGFPPITAFALLSCAWAIGAGLFLGIVVKNFKLAKIANPILLVLVFLGVLNIFFGLKPLKTTVMDLTIFGTMQDLSQQVVRLENPKDFNRRFGTDSGLVADWFTYRYDMPQTRDYFAQGIPHINWQNWMETAIWAWSDNWNETRFLLDWYAIKYVFVSEPHFNLKKFSGNPDDFSVASTRTFVDPGITITQFEYQKPSQIVSATNTPTILVIGAPGEYDVFLRSLAQAGLGSNQIIPIFSSKNADDFSAVELKKFEAVFLYNYSYKNFERMEKVLNDYLRGGGKIMVETFRGEETERRKLPAFFPVTRTQKADVNFDWNFIPNESQFLQNVDLTGFALASYMDNPWHVSQAPKGSLASDSEVILENDQGILMAARTYGAGKVIWSGINFPFHVADKKSGEEIKLLQNIAFWLGFDQINPSVQTSYKFIHPEKREVQVLEPAKGILFKETNFMDWQAQKQTADKRLQKTDIYFTGPGFMYIPLLDSKFPQTIIFEYKLSLIEKISFIIAILVWTLFIILLLEYLLDKPMISTKFDSLFVDKKGDFLSGATGWWDKEEE